MPSSGLVSPSTSGAVLLHTATSVASGHSCVQPWAVRMAPVPMNSTSSARIPTPRVSHDQGVCWAAK